MTRTNRYDRRRLLQRAGTLAVGAAGLALLGDAGVVPTVEAASAMSGAARPGTAGGKRMATFVLVHGTFLDSGSWAKVTPLLAQAGHQVVAPDMPGYGEDRTPPGQLTLQQYVDRITGILDEQAEPVILVGHSRGGILISQAAEARPVSVGALVYLAAYLPRTGESLVELAGQDSEAQLGPYLDINPEQGYLSIKPGTTAAELKAIFAADVSDEEWDRAFARIRPDPLAVAGTPVQTSDADFGRVPRVYIETLRDRVIGPALQRRMYEATPVRHVISMETSHSPFFAKPEELAAHLQSLTWAAP